MSQRIKLVTEWVTWQRHGTDIWRLVGERNDVVAIVQAAANGAIAHVFTEVSAGGAKPMYTAAKRVAWGLVSVEEAMRACEAALLHGGLIDLMWWVVQCLDE